MWPSLKCLRSRALCINNPIINVLTFLCGILHSTKPKNTAMLTNWEMLIIKQIAGSLMWIIIIHFRGLQNSTMAMFFNGNRIAKISIDPDNRASNYITGSTSFNAIYWIPMRKEGCLPEVTVKSAVQSQFPLTDSHMKLKMCFNNMLTL